MKFTSRIEPRGSIEFPAYSGLRIMMMPFRLEHPDTIPEHMKQWRPAVARLVQTSAVKEGVAYLTIDEAELQDGEYHRRPGLHVDGYNGGAHLGSWGGGGGGWGGATPLPRGTWGGSPAVGSWGGVPAVPVGSWGGGGGGWARNGMLLASNRVGCRAYPGEFEGVPGLNGECEHLVDQCGEPLLLQENQIYWCNPLAVHEVVPQRAGTRSFVRLSMPNNAAWFEGYTRNPTGVEPTGPILPPRTEYMSYRP